MNQPNCYSWSSDLLQARACACCCCLLPSTQPSSCSQQLASRAAATNPPTMPPEANNPEATLELCHSGSLPQTCLYKALPVFNVILGGKSPEPKGRRPTWLRTAALVAGWHACCTGNKGCQRHASMRITCECLSHYTGVPPQIMIKHNQLNMNAGLTQVQQFRRSADACKQLLKQPRGRCAAACI